jgi:hypothetical protein
MPMVPASRGRYRIKVNPFERVFDSRLDEILAFILATTNASRSELVVHDKYIFGRIAANLLLLQQYLARNGYRQLDRLSSPK